jgi:hypothetical protein
LRTATKPFATRGGSIAQIVRLATTCQAEVRYGEQTGQVNSRDVRGRNQAQFLGNGSGTGRERDPGAEWCAFAMFSGQSFEMLESLILDLRISSQDLPIVRHGEDGAPHLRLPPSTPYSGRKKTGEVPIWRPAKKKGVSSPTLSRTWRVTLRRQMSSSVVISPLLPAQPPAGRSARIESTERKMP